MSVSLKTKIKSLLKKILSTISPGFRKMVMLEELAVRNENNISKISSQLNQINQELAVLDIVDSKISQIESTLKDLQQTKQDTIGTRLNSLAASVTEVNEKIEVLIPSKEENKVKVSIICLIYKSTHFAKAVYNSLHKFTPMLETGEAELLFVANDATKNVLDFLKKNNYNHVINNNPHLTEEELFKRGFGGPDYISRVYMGYNYGIRKSKGKIVVLINSDNMFSPRWLENLLNKLDENRIISSQLVERMHPKFSVFPGAIHAEFGSHPDNFQEEKFVEFVGEVSKDEVKPGGAYMPCIIHKDNIEKVGYYPEGNIAGKSFNEIVHYGDERFYEKLKNHGIEHYTALDSIVYHFKEGERED